MGKYEEAGLGSSALASSQQPEPFAHNGVDRIRKVILRHLGDASGLRHADWPGDLGSKHVSYHVELVAKCSRVPPQPLQNVLR